MSRHATALAATAALVCGLAGALLTAAPASAASRGFRIYNLSSHPLKLVKAEAANVSCDGCSRDTHVWEGRPGPGAVLMPGAEAHDWELAWGLFGHYHAEVTYDVVGTNATYTATLDTWTSESDSACALPQAIGSCTAEGVVLTVSDPPGTVHDIPRGQAQQQAETLRDLCKRTNQATCEFKPTQEERTSSPAHLVGDPVVNCQDDDVEDRVTREDKVGESNSLDIKTGVEAETNFIIEKAKVSITIAYGHEWTTEHTFTQDLTLKVRPGDMAWVASTAPILRDTGDFVLKLGNTTWTLRDVSFDTPDPTRTAHFVVDHRALTPEEYTAQCTHTPPESSGLTTAPASLVALRRDGSAGHDSMIGGPASDTMRGLAGNDVIRGGAGHDHLYGGPGRDALYGGPGADTIVDHRGATLVRTGTAGAPGHDVADVADGHDDDMVVCGSRRSTVIADRGDRVIGPCGKVLRTGG